MSNRIIGEVALESFQDAIASLTELKGDEVVVSVRFQQPWLAQVNWQMDVMRTVKSTVRVPPEASMLMYIADSNYKKVVTSFLDFFEITNRQDPQPPEG